MLKMDPKEGLVWAFRENIRCLAPVLPEDYILDLDPTVKTVYGEQEGAEVGYNPHKPGHKSCLKSRTRNFSTRNLGKCGIMIA